MSKKTFVENNMYQTKHVIKNCTVVIITIIIYDKIHIMINNTYCTNNLYRTKTFRS